MKNKILKEFDNLEICDMTRAEAELHSIRTSIESYKMILKTNKELTPEKVIEIQEKIKGLSEIRDEILAETYNYGV